MTVAEVVQETLAAVREDLHERGYLYDDPQAYQAAVEDCLIATAERLAMEVEAAVHEQLDVLAQEVIEPVTVTKAGVEVLRARWQELSEEDRTAVLDSLYRNTEHLVTLLGALRQRGAVRVERRTMAVGTVVRDVVEDTNAAIGAERVRVAVPHEQVLATVDPHALRRILDPLLSNALKYGSPDGQVTVTVEAADDRVDIRVVDEGPGIAAADREAVFDQFRRLDFRTTGSGLGLYLARRLARAQGGDLTVVSGDRDCGAVLRVQLVRTVEVPEAAVDDDPSPVVGPAAGRWSARSATGPQEPQWSSR